MLRRLPKTWITPLLPISQKLRRSITHISVKRPICPPLMGQFTPFLSLIPSPTLVLGQTLLFGPSVLLATEPPGPCIGFSGPPLGVLVGTFPP